MSEDREKVLEMLAKGTISVNAADELLEKIAKPKPSTYAWIPDLVIGVVGLFAMVHLAVRPQSTPVHSSSPS
jgi:hypothetical protein